MNLILVSTVPIFLIPPLEAAFSIEKSLFLPNNIFAFAVPTLLPTGLSVIMYDVETQEVIKPAIAIPKIINFVFFMLL